MKFVRADSEVADALKESDAADAPSHVEEVFKKIAGDNTKIVFSNLKDKNVPAILSVSEEMRRFEDMMRLYTKEAPKVPGEETLNINVSSPIILKISETYDSDPEKSEKIASQVYLLCKLTMRRLTEDELSDFLTSSYGILEQL